jgi:hypothetical protein
MPKPTQPLPRDPVVRVLRSPGCASWRAALDATVDAMRAVGLPGEPEVVVVNGYGDGVRYSFRGSPTVTVDGVDVEPHAKGQPGMAFG